MLKKGVENMKQFKRAIKIVMLILSIVVLQACQVNPETNYIFQPISERIQQNKESIKELYDAQIIDKDSYDKVIEALETKQQDIERLQEQLKDAGQKELSALQNDGTLKQILGSVSGFWDVSFSDVQNEYPNKDQFESAVLTALLKDYQGQINLYGNLNSNGNVQQPFEILDDSMEETIKTSEKGKVFIIDMQKVQGLSEDGEVGTSIDQLNKYMNCYISIMNDLRAQGTTDITLPDGTKVTKENFDSALGNVFSILKDNEGNDVQWIDLQTFDVIQEQKTVGPSGSQGITSGEQTITGGLQIENYENTPGNDIVIQNQVKNKDGQMNTVNIMTIRTEELNSNVIQEMVAEVNDGTSQRMLIYNGNLYLFAYPIAVVDAIRLQEDGNFNIEYAVEDQVLISFKSQSIIKTNGISDVKTNNETPYISIGTGEIRDYQQFILQDGTLTTEMNLAGSGSGSNIIEDNTSSNIPVFILRDYLEGSFSPGVLNDGEINESVVCFGRLIRLKLKSQNNASYNIQDSIGYFIDQDHNKITGKTGFDEIYVTSIADGQSLLSGTGGEKQFKRLPQPLESVGTVQQGDTNADKITSLKQETVNEIHPVLSFPGDLDAWDKDMQDKPQMYQIVIGKDIESSGLMQHWITSDDEKLSLTWWQSYLNKRGYNYKLTAETVNNWLNVNYQISIDSKDYVIFDLDKINKINEQISSDKTGSTLRKLRAVGVAAGWLIQIWGAILIIAWVYDSNIGIGFKALEKLQFGSMTAIKYEDEYTDYYQKDGPKPITLSKLMIRVMVLIAIGFTLITVDVLDIATKLFGMVYNLIEVIQGLMS